ncbi:MAG: Com family DNA-binding transcriptional regulator [Patescibacteria group bacterium]
MVLSYNEYRCPHCGKLMFKGLLVDSEIEIKCRSCRQLNVVQSSSHDAYLCMKKECPNRIRIEPQNKE